MFVVVGAFLDIFGIYDWCVKTFGGGAMVPITSFGHLLIHGALEQAGKHGILGLSMGMFDLTASGIISAIVIAFFLSQIFKAKD
jgi:stage V sporulation protein AE